MHHNNWLLNIKQGSLANWTKSTTCYTIIIKYLFYSSTHQSVWENYPWGLSCCWVGTCKQLLSCPIYPNFMLLSIIIIIISVALCFQSVLVATWLASESESTRTLSGYITMTACSCNTMFLFGMHWFLGCEVSFVHSYMHDCTLSESRNPHGIKYYAHTFDVCSYRANPGQVIATSELPCLKVIVMQKT